MKSWRDEKIWRGADKTRRLTDPQTSRRTDRFPRSSTFEWQMHPYRTIGASKCEFPRSSTFKWQMHPYRTIGASKCEFPRSSTFKWQMHPYRTICASKCEFPKSSTFKCLPGALLINILMRRWGAGKRKGAASAPRSTDRLDLEATLREPYGGGAARQENR